jgi:hypothetical protein
MALTQYRIRIKRGDVEIEVEGDKAYVKEAIADLRRLLSVEPSSVGPPPKPGKAPEMMARTPKPQSVREFLDIYDLKRHTDIVLTFGYYLEKRRSLSGFTPADINKCYYEAKMEPSNTSQMIIENMKKGYMMEAHGSEKGKRKYVLTQKGEKFVESGFVKDKK